MPAPDSANRRSRMAALALGLALLGAASMVYYHLVLFRPQVRKVAAAKHLAGEYAFGDDFYPIWVTSRRRAGRRRDPYSREATQEIQAGLFGRPLEGQLPTDPPPDYRTFAYPAYVDLLLWPAAEVPFPVLRIAWVALLAVLAGASVVLWTRALRWTPGQIWLSVILLLALCNYPVLEGLYAGQLGILVGFLLAASLLSLVRGRLLFAGVLLGLATIKPQMTLLAILYLLLWSVHDWRRRGRFAISFCATMMLLTGASLAVWPNWIESWKNVILGYHRYATPPLALDLLGWKPGLHSNIVLIIVTLVAASIFSWRYRRATADSHEFWLSVSGLLALTAITVLPGQAVYDHVILLPGILLLACRKEQGHQGPIFRLLLLVAAGVLLWPWLASLGLIALRPFIGTEQFYSSAVFALPLRTAGPLPFTVLALLALALRKQLRRQSGSISTSLPAQ
jgi:hypothetical protein